MRLRIVGLLMAAAAAVGACGGGDKTASNKPDASKDTQLPAPIIELDPELQTYLATWERQAIAFNFLDDTTGEHPGRFMQDVIADWESKLAAAQEPGGHAPEAQVVTGMGFVIENLGQSSGGVSVIDIAAVYGMRVDEKGVRRYSENATAMINGEHYENYVLVYLDANGQWQSFLVTPGGAGWFTENMERARLAAAWTDEGKGTPQISWATIDKASFIDEEPGSIKVKPTNKGLFAFHRVQPARPFYTVTEAIATAFGPIDGEPVSLAAVVGEMGFPR